MKFMHLERILHNSGFYNALSRASLNTNYTVRTRCQVNRTYLRSTRALLGGLDPPVFNHMVTGKPNANTHITDEHMKCGLCTKLNMRHGRSSAE
jgi:hypothetical protein